MEDPYPIREAWLSCAVMALTAGLFFALLTIATALVIMWG
jgi:hypothetical protein